MWFSFLFTPWLKLWFSYLLVESDCPVRRECSAAILLFYFRGSGGLPAAVAICTFSGVREEDSALLVLSGVQRALNYDRAHRTSRGAVRYVVFTDWKVASVVGVLSLCRVELTSAHFGGCCYFFLHSRKPPLAGRRNTVKSLLRLPWTANGEII